MAEDVKAPAEEETIEEVPVEELDKVAGGNFRASEEKPDFEKSM